MKIAYCVQDYTKAGGIERYLRVLSGILSSQGHEVHIFTSRLPDTGNTHINFHHISIARFLPFFMRFYLFGYKVKRELSKSQFDIIHSQGSDCLVHNVLTAHSCHKDWVEMSKKYSLWERMKKALNPIHRLVLNREKYNYSAGNYKSIITVSNNVKNEIMNYYHVQEKNITVIYPGVNLKEFGAENTKQWRNPFRERYHIAENEIIVLFVSNEFRRKGLASLIEALSILKNNNIRLFVVGSGVERPYRTLANKLGVKTVFIPRTEHVNRYYAMSDIFVLPTKHEAFGMVITEAMAAGLPVIVSRQAGASELINDERCLINNCLDSREIADKIAFFVGNAALRIETGENLRDQIKKYTWENTAAAVMKVYEHISKHNCIN
jgi:UDP-glucose:(heptosyl)LPS alpha-1,3-glucosyltransferase